MSQQPNLETRAGGPGGEPLRESDVSGGLDDGSHFGERLARLEEKAENLATKADFKALEARMESFATKADFKQLEARMEYFATKEDFKDLKGDIHDVKIWLFTRMVATIFAALALGLGIARLLF